MVIVAVADVAVNLYHTLYAVPLPQTGAGAALAAFFKLPVMATQVDDGVSVPAPAQLAWANIFAEKLIKIKNKPAVRTVDVSMALKDLNFKIRVKIETNPYNLYSNCS